MGSSGPAHHVTAPVRFAAAKSGTATRRRVLCARVSAGSDRRQNACVGEKAAFDAGATARKCDFILTLMLGLQVRADHISEDWLMAAS